MMSNEEWLKKNRAYTEDENIDLISADKLLSNPAIKHLFPFEMIEPLVAIFERVGYECGRIKRVLEDHKVSWGYFTDHNPFEPHCNSHPNNFVVLDPSKEYSGGNLLAPIDFDFSYDFDTFVSTVQETTHYTTRNQEQFDSWISSERYELEQALGGDENMANFSYESASTGKVELDDQLQKSILKVVMVMMRDVCVLNFREAFDKVNWDRESSRFHMLKEDVSKLVVRAMELTEGLET